MAHILLAAVELLAASIWIGGFIALGVVAQVARLQLEPATRIDFFRSLGRRYLGVAGSSLFVALACGGLLFANGRWTGTNSVVVTNRGVTRVGDGRRAFLF